MFKIESYITPIILNYLAKYVKNIRPKDFQVSLWEGEVTFQNLDLRLEVLEQEIKFPFEFISGHVHELILQVPWTKITSEPIKVSINTIEFVLKSKTNEAVPKTSTSNSPEHPKKTAVGTRGNSFHKDEESGHKLSGLAKKIINNINVVCQNIILKYVEEDIVVSMNVQHLSYSPANDHWQPAMVDYNPHKILMRKLIKISDLTICLDKQNSAGQIDVCQEPVLYRCTLEIRFLRKYNSNTKESCSTTRIGILSQALDFNLSSLQLPMLMRLIKFLVAVINRDDSGEDRGYAGNTDLHRYAIDEGIASGGETYMSWAWNLLPSFTFVENDEIDTSTEASNGHIKDVGIYAKELNLTLKNSEFINDAMMGGMKRIRYMPIVRFSFGGLYFERVAVKEIDWCSTKVGMSSIYVEPLGEFRTEENKDANALIQTAPFTNMRSFIDKSLFDDTCKISDRGWGVTNYEDYIARITDDYLLYRSPIFAFDMIKFRNKEVPGLNFPMIGTRIPVVNKQYRVMSSGVTLRFHESALQVKNIINSFIETYDSIAYSSNVEKIENLEQSTTAKARSVIFNDNQTATNDGSPKLHPPLVEDYDALMQGIPLCKYKIDLKRIRLEIYAKTEPESEPLPTKRLTKTAKRLLPFFKLDCGSLQGNLSTPLNPDKLVHTTCQLPDKPIELLNASYDNYELNVKDFSVCVVSRSKDDFIRLITIPKLQICYGTLLQPHLWKVDEVPIKKLDILCDQIKIEASKRELFTSLYLYSAVWSYLPQTLTKLLDIRNRPLVLADTVSLFCLISKCCVKRRYYHTFDVWNGIVGNLSMDVLMDRKSVAGERYNIFSTVNKMHNNQNKWLEMQVQFPYMADAQTKPKEPQTQIYMAIGIWMEKFYFIADHHLLDFLSFTYKEEAKNEWSVEYEMQTTNFQNPPGSATTYSQQTNSAPSTSLPYHSNASLPQVFGRKSSRASSIRKISHPEETIHYSSEKDERLEYVTAESPPVNVAKEKCESSLSDEDKIKNYFDKYNSIIIFMEMAQSQVDITHKALPKDFHPLTASKNDSLTRLFTPRISLKSTYAEYITRSSLRLKVSPPLTAKTAFNWTIIFSDLSMAVIYNAVVRPVLNPCQTTLTVAMTQRRQIATINTDITQYYHRHMSEHKQELPKAKLKEKYDEDYLRRSLDHISTTSDISQEKSTGNNTDGDISSNASEPPKASGSTVTKTDYQKQPQIGPEIVCLNLHLDSSTIHLFGDNIKEVKTHLKHLLTIVDLATAVSLPKRATSTSRVPNPVRILSSTEEDRCIKEFMDLDSNSDITSAPRKITKSMLNNMSLFCQWSVAKVIAEIGNPPQFRKRNKIVVDLEDFLCTVDRGQDFIKYTSKIGNFNLNYHKQNSKSPGEWQAEECLCIRRIAETNDLPFLNVVITKVSLSDFYKRIGVKRKGETDRNISEILVVMQALEFICDLDRMHEFVQPTCGLLESNSLETNLQNSESQDDIIRASELPLFHFESKGITCYFPLDIAKNQMCTVLICKIGSIKISPNLQNPLQRKPIRPDVYGKAASMGILSLPGSMIEDRQYEMTIGKVSAASTNWTEILMHMRNKDQNIHTNPAVEWNNPERKQSLRLTEIFKNFTLIAIYAPNIVYNDILICGEALEFNCASDFIANLNTDQLFMFASYFRKVQQISVTINSACQASSKSLDIVQSIRNSKADGVSLYLSAMSLSSYSIRNEKSLNRSAKYNSTVSDSRKFLRMNSSSKFESINEDIEPPPMSDSGVHSMFSKPSRNKINTGESFFSLSSSSTLLDKINSSYPNISTNALKRELPKTISLVAGIFCFKIFASPADSYLTEKEYRGKPLISLTISQPSFMRIQNLYDNVMNFSVFNFSVFLPALTFPASKEAHLFTEPIVDTLPGEINSTGIPPSLLQYRAYQTKFKMREIDIDISKPLVITLSEKYIEKICTNLIIIYNSIQTPKEAFIITSCPEPISRKSKINLMKSNTFNADRLNFKCNNIALRLTNHQYYECELICREAKLNLKYLTRPEKCSIKYSLGSIYLRTQRRVVIHPIALKGSMELISEPWNRLPLINIIIKFNVVQIEMSVPILWQCRHALETLRFISEYTSNEWDRYQTLNQFMDAEGNKINRNRLRQLKCPSSTTFIQNNKSLKREEFYQDDLRAGAFQYVEITTDAVLPLPYQIQIIKKDYGIICWRYPQPRKMCKIHIYPVPMAISNPIHIKCRMEYFSDVHEKFLHYCDFWLSETNSKDIKIPEREVCANIWRVVILQSLVSVNGECFDTSEDDEELQTIASSNIDEILNTNRLDSDFILHPKVLVGCMRVDTTFQSMSVPKIQMLLSCNSVCLKLLNQPDENLELPLQLKRFRYAKSPQIPQAFLIFGLTNTKVHSIFYDRNKYNSNVSFTCYVKYLDYGFLNILPLVEDTTMQAYFDVDKKKNTITSNLVMDRLRVNFGPSVIHTLLSSKNHWEECMDEKTECVRHALIPKCVFVNRIANALEFGQSGTNERITLYPKDCYLYSFYSDAHSQEITLYITDEETNTVETSESFHIPFKFESKYLMQHVCIGSKYIALKIKKLTSSQIMVLIKGQIELISMLPYSFSLEFHEEKVTKKPMENLIDKNGRNSFFASVNQQSNISMRIKLPENKTRTRTGDIPLKTNKKLPWLVKVPNDRQDFVSVWVRILREDIPDVKFNTYCPQKILICIWPIFEISSMLDCPIKIKTESPLNEIELAGKGGNLVLNAAATHLTEHHIEFLYNKRLGPDSKTNFKLRLKSLDWQKFFWYDEQKWTIENTIESFSKVVPKKWPIDDVEEMRVRRIMNGSKDIDVIYKTKPSREFACTLTLEVLPWGTFINSTGTEIRLNELSNDLETREITIAANAMEMLFDISKGFTIDVYNGFKWIKSWPIFFENDEALQKDDNRYYIVSEAEPTELVILVNKSVLKFVLKLKLENDRKILKLCSKFSIANYTKTQLCILPFAMDQKENITMKYLKLFDGKVSKTTVNPNQEWENGIGVSLSKFYDINYETAERSEDTEYVYFLVVKVCEEAEAGASIPLSLANPFNRKCFSIQNGKDSISLSASLIENNGIYYFLVYEDPSPAVLVSNQTECPFIMAQTNASENSKVTAVIPEYDGKHFEWYQVVPRRSKCYYTPPEWYARFPEVDSTLSNITFALYHDDSMKKTVKWSKPIRTDKTWKKYLHIPGHGDVKVIICDKHRVIRIYIYYISQQMEFSVKDLRLRLSSTEPAIAYKEPIELPDSGSSSTITNLYTETPQFSKPDVCHHFRNECDCRPDVKIRFFVKEIIFSLHTDLPQRQYMKSEVLGIFVDDFLLAFDDSEDERLLNIVIPNLQIDNQLFSTGKYDFPVVLCADKLYEKTETLPDPYYLNSFYKNVMGETSMINLKLKLYEDEYKLSTVNCRFGPVRAYIEDAYITDVLDALVDCEPSNCVFRPKLKGERKKLKDNQILVPQDVENQALLLSDPLLLRSFVIEPMSVLLSVHTSVRMYIALDHSPLSFSTYERKHLLTMPMKFGQSLGMHYLSGAIFGAGWVVGSLEILGSPSGFARSVTTGLKDFVSLPVRGLFRGPWGFVVGVTQGSASLLKNVTAGTVNSVSKLAASVARNLDRLTLDEEHIERTEALRRTRPQGFTEGLSQGMTGLGISILGAVGGLAHHTLEARSTVEVFTGLSKGLVGALTKPISGAAELVALAGQGMLQTVGFNAMPMLRSPSACHNMAIAPSAYRTWKLFPRELVSDQILFHNEVTIIVERQPRKGFVFLTSTMFAVVDGTCDKMLFAFPIDKVEVTTDAVDKTMCNVRVIDDDLEEEAQFTNQRIMNFLHSSLIKMTSDSLYDILQTHTNPEINDNTFGIGTKQALEMIFYISEHLGDYIICYIKIIKSKLYSH